MPQEQYRSNSNVSATDGIIRRAISFQSENEALAGDLVFLAGLCPHPAILAIAGTGSQNRYGDVVLQDGKVLPHSRYRWNSTRLALAGIASLYWNKRGVGKSTGGDRRPGDPPGDRSNKSLSTRYTTSSAM